MTTPNANMTSAPIIYKADVSTQGLRFKLRASTLGVTVHCAATRPSQNWGAKEVDRSHRLQGYLCLGYHFVIRRDGVIEEGRPLDVEGSHARDGGRNRTHIGICLIGGVSEHPQKHTPGNKWNGSDAECNFTPAQMTALRNLLAHLKATQFGGKDFPVEGHRDIPGVKKACPSFDVAHWLKTNTLVL
jgi:N-acetylmuramoyl-L-alanine amidase